MNAMQNEYEQHYNDRQYQRNFVAIDAWVRPRNGSKTSVKILDISETGFRMLTTTRLNEEVDIFLMIPGFESLQASIIWSNSSEYGCTFLNPLYTAIFEHISSIFASQSRQG